MTLTMERKKNYAPFGRFQSVSPVVSLPRKSIRTSNRKVVGSTPANGSTRIFSEYLRVTIGKNILISFTRVNIYHSFRVSEPVIGKSSVRLL